MENHRQAHEELDQAKEFWQDKEVDHNDDVQLVMLGRELARDWEEVVRDKEPDHHDVQDEDLYLPLQLLLTAWQSYWWVALYARPSLVR